MKHRLALAVLLCAGLVAYLVYLKGLDSLIAPPQPHVGTSPAPAPDPASSGGTRTPSSAEPVTVVGRLVDVEGQPFADLRVVASAPALVLETHTDAQGAFELAGLPRTELVLDPGADFDPAEPLGVRRIAGQVAALTLDLGRDPGPERARLDLGALVVPRSRPFWIEGRVTLDEEWARAKGTWLGDVRLELAPPSPDDFLPPREVPGAPRDWNRPPWCDTLPAAPTLAEDGSFRFAVETPHDPFLLRVLVKRFEPLERLLVPTPDGLHSETFRLPAGR